MANEIALLTTFSGAPIRTNEGGLVSLNDLWTAAGSPANRDPRHWLFLPESKRFVAFLCRRDNVRKSDILKTVRGRNGGSWGHWKIALDYAAYLSQPLKDHIYEVFRERYEEDADPELGFQRWQERTETKYQKEGQTKEWIATRIRAIVVRKIETDTLKAHGVTEGKEYGIVTNAAYEEFLGHSAKALKRQRGLPDRANLRDHLQVEELLGLTLIEWLAREKIEREGRMGVHACAAACRDSARHVAEALRKDLGDPS